MPWQNLTSEESVLCISLHKLFPSSRNNFVKILTSYMKPCLVAGDCARVFLHPGRTLAKVAGYVRIICASQEIFPSSRKIFAKILTRWDMWCSLNGDYARVFLHPGRTLAQVAGNLRLLGTSADWGQSKSLVWRRELKMFNYQTIKKVYLNYSTRRPTDTL